MLPQSTITEVELCVLSIMYFNANLEGYKFQWFCVMIETGKQFVKNNHNTFYKWLLNDAHTLTFFHLCLNFKLFIFTMCPLLCLNCVVNIIIFGYNKPLVDVPIAFRIFWELPKTLCHKSLHHKFLIYS